MKNQKRTNKSWTEFTIIQTSRIVYYELKRYCSVLKCSKFKLIRRSDNYGHLHYSCKNTGERFSDRHTVKRRLNWLKNYFRAFPGSWYGNSSGICRHSCWISFSFPVCTEVALGRRPLCQWNHWERVTSSVVVPSKATNCRTQLPGYGLDVTRVPIMVEEHCHRCSSQAVVCKMWLYTCSLWHLFHHVSSVVVPRGAL